MHIWRIVGGAIGDNEKVEIKHLLRLFRGIIVGSRKIDSTPTTKTDRAVAGKILSVTGDKRVIIVGE